MNSMTCGWCFGKGIEVLLGEPGAPTIKCRRCGGAWEEGPRAALSLAPAREQARDRSDLRRLAGLAVALGVEYAALQQSQESLVNQGPHSADSYVIP